MSILRQVRPARNGNAGYEVQGLPHTYDEATAKRLQYMDEDGEYEYPTDGVLAEVDPLKKRAAAVRVPVPVVPPTAPVLVPVPVAPIPAEPFPTDE